MFIGALSNNGIKIEIERFDLISYSYCFLHCCFRMSVQFTTLGRIPQVKHVDNGVFSDLDVDYMKLSVCSRVCH